MWYKRGGIYYYIDSTEQVWRVWEDGAEPTQSVASAEKAAQLGQRIDKPMQPWADAALRFINC